MSNHCMTMSEIIACSNIIRHVHCVIDKTMFVINVTDYDQNSLFHNLQDYTLQWSGLLEE